MIELDQTLRLLAGGTYQELLSSLDAARKHLTNSDPNVRAAALVVCVRNWNCQADRGFLDQCRRMAATDCDDSVRVQAIVTLGIALGSTKDVLTSRFLADLIKTDAIPRCVRRAAYLALREIQDGFSESIALGQFASVLKEMMSRHPNSSEIRAQLDAIRDEFGQIDLAFVNKHASPVAQLPGQRGNT